MLRFKSIYFSFILLSTLLYSDVRTVAISYFDNTSGTEEYNPLSKGLADMLITDLSNVKSIQIVEREKLENLLKEIELGDSKFMDASTAQKLGQGLGAGYMLTGSYLIMDETMRIDARLVDVGTGEISMAEEITGNKEHFFELEKNLVQKFIKSFNLELSRLESRKVNKVQTESFESFSAYSSSLDAYDKGNYEESKELLEEAVRIDEDFEIAWDRLEELLEEINELVKARSLNLSASTIKTIDDAFQSKNKNQFNTAVRMFNAMQSECFNLLMTFDVDYVYDSYPLFDDSGNVILTDALKKLNIDFQGNLILTIDQFKKVFIKKFQDYISAIRYLDSKEFDPDLGGDLGNPFKLVWSDFLFQSEYYYGLFTTLDAWYGPENLTLINSIGEDEFAYKVVDELIIDYGSRFIKVFPYTSEEFYKGKVERAIQRKMNSDIISAHKWISKVSSSSPSFSSVEALPLSLTIKNPMAINLVSPEVISGLQLMPREFESVSFRNQICSNKKRLESLKQKLPVITEVRYEEHCQ